MIDQLLVDLLYLLDEALEVATFAKLRFQLFDDSLTFSDFLALLGDAVFGCINSSPHHEELLLRRCLLQSVQVVLDLVKRFSEEIDLTLRHLELILQDLGSRYDLIVFIPGYHRCILLLDLCYLLFHQ